MVKAEDLQTRNKAGKALITVDDDATILKPLLIGNKESDLLAVASKTGRLLIYKVSELPELSQGKGNKLIGINGAKLAIGADGIATMEIIPEKASMIIHCGKRTINLSSKEIEERISSRSKAGDLLPRGFQKIDSLEIVVPKSEEEEVQTPPIEDTEFTLE